MDLRLSTLASRTYAYSRKMEQEDIQQFHHRLAHWKKDRLFARRGEHLHAPQPRMGIRSFENCDPQLIGSCH